MIRIALFDVGETLLHNGQAFPGTIDSLRIISALRTEAGDPLSLGIVSNFLPTPQPPAEAAIRAIEEQFRTTILEPAGIAPFFKPFEEKVTLSTRAGVAKPERAIFEAALQRLHFSGPLSSCLFITEDAAHLAKVAEYGIVPIGFRVAPPGVPSFDDWQDAPLLIAGLLAPDDERNLDRAATAWLDRRHGLADFTPQRHEPGKVSGEAKQLLQLDDPRLGDFNGLYVERPTEVTVELASLGRAPVVRTTSPDAEELAETVNYVQTLIHSDQIARPGESRLTTHALETDDQGRQRLVRKRFSR